LNRGGRNAFGDKPVVLAMFIILISSRSKINQAMYMSPFAFVIDYHMTMAPGGYQSQGVLQIITLGLLTCSNLSNKFTDNTLTGIMMKVQKTILS
jgi:hypothetical protein